MDIKDFKSGCLKQGYKYQYFMPEKINHDFSWEDPSINTLLEKASFHLGALNSFSSLVPDADMFIIMHIFKEAVISNRIEGTRTNIEEALNEQNNLDPEKRDDWQEVHNYVKAMNNAIQELEKLPLSNRLIKNTHKILLSTGRGEHKSPGEFRISQNWIGGTTLSDAVFIPPSHEELPDLLSDFELFLNNNNINIPHLIRIAIAHYQFETIHPFLDGNGRIGRLLISLYLVHSKVLQKPLLYLSDFFEKNKTLYYDNLTFVRTKNNLSQWIKYFLEGVSQTAENSAQTLKKIIDLKTDLEKNKLVSLGKRTKTANEFLYLLFHSPVITSASLQKEMKITAKTANSLINAFIELNVLKERTGYSRNRIFVFDEYVKLFM
ncbi:MULTISPECIES: Fic family protein [unclassified Treponema]|uniref:Fic family protein n=1 Tax=unclassified Treponema TaxID=2638727 RepID=UPI0020A30D3C|nr:MULTISPECIES: Fic family protein [unclassified Treponema]UTC66778.1 Fic family protein [Treponema sp. OMZ 789]UTC69511.1 Fic family protein [Treponema sp. OMZ 790]UTC72225.1 Fic family protein [Treponema sp. OMZ 791]